MADLSNEKKTIHNQVKNFDILDTPPEIEFDIITKLISELFDAPVALISFFDGQRVFIKSAFGYQSATNINLENSLFEFSNVPVSIGDLLQTELPNKPPFYLGNRQVRSYISEPITTDDGCVIGNICAINFKEMQISHHQLSMFKTIVKLVLEKLNSRLFLRDWIKLSDERVHMLIHDLKNPMTTLCLHSELVGKMASNTEKVILMAGKMNKQAKAVVNSMNNILSSSRTENGIVKMTKEKLDVNILLGRVEFEFANRLQQNRQNLTVNLNHEVFVYGNESRLISAISALVDNAIKFSEPEQKIEINVREEDSNLIISIQDEGKGILSNEKDQLFTKFAKLANFSPAHQKSKGLGLSIVKMLIDLHKGKIWAESKGRGLGSIFHIELPTK